MNVREALPQIVMEYAVLIDDFVAEGPNELTSKQGDFVQVLYHIDKKWAYVSRQVDKRVGYVPFLYCAFIKTITYGNIGNQLSVVAVKPQTKELLRVNTQSETCSSDRSSLTDNSDLMSPRSLSSDKSLSTDCDRKLIKTRSEPDGGSWIGESREKLQEIIAPPSPYMGTFYKQPDREIQDRHSNANLMPFQSYTDRIVPPKKMPTTPNMSHQRRVCEPYQTIVNELEDCLEKLTLV